MTGRSGAALLAILLPVALGAGCGEREAPVADRLERAIAAYEAGEPEPTAEEIEALFARLDAEVATARADAAEADGAAKRAAETRARDLARRRNELAEAYVRAAVTRLGDAAADTVREMGRKVGEGIEEAGRRIRESLEPPAPPAGE